MSPDVMSEQEVREFARRIAEYCFSLEPRLQSVDLTIDQRARRRLVVGFDGSARRRSASCRPRVIIVLRSQAEDGSPIRVVRGTSAAGLEWLQDAGVVMAREVARRSGTKVVWRKGASRLPVMLEAGWCAGVWIHEVVGHQLEADNFQRGWSIFRSRGERVCDADLTVVDRPGAEELSGFILFDDEGTPSSGADLVREGHVAGLLHDLKTAESFAEAATGNGRRQDYRFQPQPRISNLVVARGGQSRQDFVDAYPEVLRVRSISRGHVDVLSGRFQFVVDDAEIIERGEARAAPAHIVIEGDTFDALKSIAMIGDEMVSDEGRGRCLKHGQLVDVGVFTPSILIEDLTIRPLSG